MEARPNRGRQTSWKRGGGGSDSGASGGEHRVRGRGRYGTGRGKRDHYRGRGRGGPPSAFERGQTEESKIEVEEDEEKEIFTRRKLESNWDRYEESEKQETNSDMPTQRGTDYYVLLESAGDSFTQFRFSEEKEWEMDPLAANQMSAVLVDLPALAESLQELPLHRRLNLEAELIQVLMFLQNGGVASVNATVSLTHAVLAQVVIPVELPSITMASKHHSVVMGMSKPSLLDCPAARRGLTPSLGISNAPSPVVDTALSSATAEPLLVDDEDEELNQLLSLPASGYRPGGVEQQITVLVPDKPPGETLEKLVPELEEEEKLETKAKEEVAEPPKTNTAAMKVTEEDLEDWLDSMIS
ncbi:cell death regulator Aven isoform X1 [Esox lucius]|uniref:Apoptosis, caspase activation inhibitor n=1 Tax=Esox lucius TaxID=8010 RepID=A0A6Q2XSB4_ESOLU|nr:cell death regulator Aven isoform X1 [Esox lucius]XP_019898306.2 cell death regulator Aven isoform X1 [Esox lucius]